jgi:hypothetical protein
MGTNNPGIAQSLYQKYTTLRDPYLTRARDCAKVTIPTLIPPHDEAGGSTKYTTPYQGLGARGVNNLASKLLLALLPPNSPFFKYSIDDFQLQELARDDKVRTEVEEGLNKIERAVMNELEVTAVRISLFEVLKHLLVAGNCLLFMEPTGGVRVFPLFRYVVKRDPMGNVIEHITKETASKRSLKPEILEACNVEDKAGDLNAMAVDNTLDIYTWVRRDPEAPTKRWLVSQELNGIQIPGSDGTYPMDSTPWLPLRWNKLDNEDYGRGFSEEHLGDLMSLETLTMAIVQGSAAAAKVLFLVKPNGTTSVKVLAEAPNGAMRQGNAEDVTVLQLNKFHDFRVAQETMSMISQRLSHAFMLNTSIQRSGERVTAEEIRFMAGELEDALGGVYSILSQELQLPLVKITMDNMSRQRRLPTLPKEVKPKITTGLEALGRGHDLNKLQIFFQHIAPLGPEKLQLFLNISNYIKRVGTSLGLDMSDLLNSQEEIDQAQQQAQMQQLIQQLGPQFMQMMGKMQQGQQGQPGQQQG